MSLTFQRINTSLIFQCIKKISLVISELAHILFGWQMRKRKCGKYLLSRESRKVSESPDLSVLSGWAVKC